MHYFKFLDLFILRSRMFNSIMILSSSASHDLLFYQSRYGLTSSFQPGILVDSCGAHV